MSAHSHHALGSRGETTVEPLSDAEVRLLDAYWRAANYLSVGQIYLLANPLLREPLSRDHVKPRLLGHFGTVPGLNLIWVHMNRAVRASSPTHTSRAPTASSTRRSRRTRTGCAGCSGSSRSPAASRATRRRRR